MVKNFIRTVEIITNFNCNMRCKMCDGWKMAPPKNPPSLDDYKRAILNLKEWLGNDFKIQIAGGEPLLNPNTIKIAGIAESLGIRTSIISNGSLINEEKAKELVESRISNITISLDSLNPDIHDYMRGVDGTYEKVVKALKYLSYYSKRRDKPLYLAIASIVSKLNHESLIPLIKWTEEKGYSGIIFQAINDTFFGGKRAGYDDKLWPMNESEVIPIIQTIEKIKKIKKLKTEDPRRILNSMNLLEDMQDYFKEMSWMKNVRKTL